MTERELRQRYQHFLGDRQPASREGCPSLEAIDALVVREGPEGQRLATLDHVMACRACRDEFEKLRVLHAAQDRPARIRRHLWQAAASVALLAGAGVLWRVRQQPAPDEFRGGADGVTVVSPVGTALAQPALQFVWHAVPGVATWHFELLDAEGGAVLVSASSSDTTFVLPDSVSLQPGRSYAWRVQGADSGGAQPRSAAVRFALSQP
ncbi:MAG: hypothetical protein ACHQ2E_03495 [Gemmatimonadales bacterium]